MSCMGMAYTYTGVLGFATPPLNSNKRDTTFSCCSTSTSTHEQEAATGFTYSRASPSVRWPHLEFNETRYSLQTKTLHPDNIDKAELGRKDIDANTDGEFVNGDEHDVFDRRLSRKRPKKMNKLALKRAKDWPERVQFLTHKILELKSDEFVADVLDKKLVQMTPTDFCFVVKWVGKSSWQRALEVYEWLNLRHWYAPNARMLATILAVLGKANQEALAVEIFTRAEPAVGNTVQVYNAMMGVYARNGLFSKVRNLLDLMRERGCEPDLISFNTLINARLKCEPMRPDLGVELLDEVRKSGIRPDIITYNTLISACSREPNLNEAMKIFHHMKAHKCQPDLWTYNAMISVYARCGLAGEAQHLFSELGSKRLIPDAVTYNSLLYAFAREGNVEKVNEICEEMVEQGFMKDEMTYNTVISMYGKQGMLEFAFQVYRDMKTFGRHPDAVTYTVLIDSLGKANRMNEAANLMSDMLDTSTRPTLRTYSALICGYAKARQWAEAEENFDCMVRSGIKPDSLAYSVMLDMYLRSNDVKKAVSLYRRMINDGFVPDLSLYEGLLRAVCGEKNEDCVQKLVEDLEDLHGLSPEKITSLLTKGGCYNLAAEKLKLAIMGGSILDQKNLSLILNSYSLSGQHHEAIELLNYIQEHGSNGSKQFVSESLVVIHCKAGQLDAALDEYNKNVELYTYGGSSVMYDSLIKSCAENECFSEASQVFSDMKSRGIEPSADIYRTMVLIHCKMDFPEAAHSLFEQAEAKGFPLQDSLICSSLVEAYGRVKQLEKAESVVGNLRQRLKTLDHKIWNSLIQAYAANGCYEKARFAFRTMMRDGPSPSVDTVNFLLHALIFDGRLNELYVVIQELQDMGLKISKCSTILMLEAFTQSGNIFEVKRIYQGMKAAGYLPTMHLYRVMIGLLSRAKQVKHVEAMVFEMEQSGFTPDLSIFNLLLKMYTRIEDYRKTAHVYRRIQESELEPDEETHNTLILMYCSDCRPEEAILLMRKMRQLGQKIHMNTYKSVIASFCKKLMVEEAEELFNGLKSEGHELNRSFHHLMMKMYRKLGDHTKAENLLVAMKESGIEPTLATMHLLMSSYGSSGHPVEAEKVLNSLKSMDSTLSTLPYSSVIDAYLKNGDLQVGIRKLEEMKKDGLDPDNRIWTCFVKAASSRHSMNEAAMLLNAIADAGFNIPIRLLTENSVSLLSEIDCYLEELKPMEDNAAFKFVNALEDLLWAFECRATAARIFQLAVKRKIYNHNVYRVADKDWGADFRKFSGGAALVGLTLWLDHMQDASLKGFPESPKSVVLITGTAEHNNFSLNRTLTACLWEMGSPFLPCKGRTGVLVAKSHSLRMWLKDSPFCEDLELKDSPVLPLVNSMQLIEGFYIRQGLVPAFSDIKKRLGQVTPRKFSRLALLSDEIRDRVNRADIERRRNKSAKLDRVVAMRKGVGKFRKASLNLYQHATPLMI